MICVALKTNLSMFYVFIGHLYVALAVSSLVFSWVIFSFSCKIFFFNGYKFFKDNLQFFLLIFFEAYFVFECVSFVCFETGS